MAESHCVCPERERESKYYLLLTTYYCPTLLQSRERERSHPSYCQKTKTDPADFGFSKVRKRLFSVENAKTKSASHKSRGAERE